MNQDFRKRRILFIINPVAGNGKTIEVLPIIKDKMKDVSDKIEYVIYVSKSIGDISKIVSEYYDLGYNEFVAVGGDGSFSELINGFKFPCERIATIGILPMGTGNDFVKNTIEKKNFDLIFDAILENRKVCIDVGVVNDLNFINVCSFGIDGPIIKDTDRYKKILPGQSSYLFSTLKAGVTFKPNLVKVTADDKEYKGHMILIAIGNGKYFGGGMNICPDAKLDDGLFEVCLVSDVSKLKFIREISKVYSGRLGELKEVIYLKAKKIKIEVQDAPYYINADGNLMGITPANISIIEKSVFIYTKGETV